MSSGAWFLASGLLFVGGVGVLLAALAIASADARRSPPALRQAHTQANPTVAPVPPGASVGPTLLLSADGPIGEHQVFWLQHPTRLVVDLMHVNQAIHAPVVAPKHPMLRRVRHARHSDRVRFVVEVTDLAHSHVRAHTEGTTLALTLFEKEPA